MSSNTTPPGWYPDGHGATRWWDGAQWTQHVQPPPPPSSPSPAAHPTTQQTETTTTQSHSNNDAGDASTSRRAEKITVFNAKKLAEQLQEVVSEQERAIREFGIDDAVERQRRLDELNSSIALAATERESVREQLAVERSQLVELQAQNEAQNLGLYNYEHPAQSSAELADELSRLRARIKSLNKIGQAIDAVHDFTFNNSKQLGKKMVNDYSRLMLRAYNAEVENCVKTVRAGNLATAQGRLQKAVDQIAKTGAMLGIHVTPEFHRLRLSELELAAKHLQAVQEEKEAERERKAQLREERKAEEEYRRERVRLEKERAHYANTIAALEAQGKFAEVESLREKLADTDRAIEDVDYRAAHVRAGYVYVISNLGSFGETMVKIGMTRRLDPMDRVRELGDASVPFRFDVHALFFSQDAVSVETRLHQRFAAERINKVNLRREFFTVTPQQVLDALREDDVHVIEFNPEQAADEYRASWPAT